MTVQTPTLPETKMFTVPLAKLALSPLNVRKIKTSIEDLVASIPEHGLIQPLSVLPNPDKNGHYDVIAGGRRFRALSQLSKEKKLPKDFAVPCMLRKDEQAEGVSLAENFIRIRMHPADEFDAFQRLIEGGKNISEIAQAHGVNEHFVAGRLRLASVAPKILEAFRRDKVTIMQVQSYAINTDRERQLSVFKNLPADASPFSIRRALSEGNVPSSDARVAFVSIEAYQAAGGAITQDLFPEQGDGIYLTDAALLDKLFAEKLDTVVADLKAEGWSDAFVWQGHIWELRDKFSGRVYPTVRPLTEHEEQRKADYEKRMEALGEQCNADEENKALLEAYEALGSESEAFAKQIAESSPEVYQPEDLARAVAVVTVDYHGFVSVLRGLYQQRGNATAKQGDTAVKKADSDGIELPGAPMREELAAVRTACIAADLSANPVIALVATVHALAMSALKLPGQHYGERSGVLFSAENGAPGNRIANKTMRPLSAVREALQAKREAMPEHPADWWSYFLAMDQASLLDHLAAFAAVSYKCYVQYEPAAVRVHGDQLAAALGTNPERWVTLSDLEFLPRTKKASILAALEKTKGKACAENFSKLKKSELVGKATEHLDGVWLPAALSAFADGGDHDQARKPIERYNSPYYAAADAGDDDLEDIEDDASNDEE